MTASSSSSMVCPNPQRSAGSKVSSGLEEPVYRVAEKEWKDFVEAFTDVLVEVDEQVPHLPPKDVIHRIYRDVSALKSLIKRASV